MHRVKADQLSFGDVILVGGHRVEVAAARRPHPDRPFVRVRGIRMFDRSPIRTIVQENRRFWRLSTRESREQVRVLRDRSVSVPGGSGVPGLPGHRDLYFVSRVALAGPAAGGPASGDVGAAEAACAAYGAVTVHFRPVVEHVGRHRLREDDDAPGAGDAATGVFPALRGRLDDELVRFWAEAGGRVG